MRSLLLPVSVLAVSMLAASDLIAQRNLREITPIGRDSSEQERLDYMMKSVEEYTVKRIDDGQLVPLHSKPLMRWSNPISNVADGLVVMWARDGVPEVVAQVFLSRADLWLHEFESLTEAELSFTRASTGEELWRPIKSVTRHSIPRAPVPDASKNRRLLQMKQLARRFSADVMFKPNPGQPETQAYQLRMQPRPIYRYQTKNTPIVDGALFAFVQGTNPEVFLVVEVVRGEQGMQFRHGLSPMTAYAVSAKLDGNDIWSVPPQKRPFPREGAFYFRQHQLAERESE